MCASGVRRKKRCCGLSLERHVPSDHVLRKIEDFVDLKEARAHLKPYLSEVERPLCRGSGESQCKHWRRGMLRLQITLR